MGIKRNSAQNQGDYGEIEVKKRKLKVCQCKRTINSKRGVCKHHQVFYKSDKYSEPTPKLTTASDTKLGTRFFSDVQFLLLFYDDNDRPCGFPDTHLPFSVIRQIFLKISKICKKINFDAFFMNISLQGGHMKNIAKNASECYLYG